MSQDQSAAPDSAPPPPPPPPVPVRPLEYRGPGAAPNPQWWTDDQPGLGWVILGLLLLSGLGVVGAVVLTVLSFVVGC